MVEALTLQLSNIWRNFAAVGGASLAIPLVLFCIIVMMVIPLPPFLLDLFFTANIALSLIIVMICISALRPLDFSSFPTVLLFATLLRLALNVASTRVVLVEGHTGSGAAGSVIEAFGEFIIAGNYLIGIIVFSILMIINFVVVTKGAGRVSEVTARFTLDAMPGKQMAIDADLNAGILTKEEAKLRRAEVAAESEFYGSMDGASKFVKGDVIAGIIILVINIVGGLVIGVAFHGMSLADAAQTYALLTIGDGLVAQIPSLLLATATAIIVTRVSADTTMHSQMKTQMGNMQPLAVTSGILLIIGVIPGMPNLMFLSMAAVAGGLAYLSYKRSNSELEESDTSESEETQSTEISELSWDDVPKVDVIGLEVGYALIPLIDKEQGGDLMQRIKGVRKKLSHQLGFLVQTVHIRDNLDLTPNQYRININGVTRGQAELMPGRELAINPGVTHGALNGIETRDPAFGLEATWITPDQKEYAQTLGYTVVDASTALATHLNKILQENARDLIGHDEAQQLLDQLATVAPKLVESLVPKKISLGVFTAVLQNLLEEGVPIRNIKGIVEVLSHSADSSQNAAELTSAVRPSLGRMIVQSLAEIGQDLSVMTLAPDLEQLLHNVLQQGMGGDSIEPTLAEQLLTNLYTTSEQLVEEGIQPVLIVSPSVRPWLAKFVKHRVPGLVVLGFNEIPDEQGIRVVRTIDRKANDRLEN